ncbi:MAG: flagellar basal body rod protein FlgC [Acidobacteriota bacterium]
MNFFDSLAISASALTAERQRTEIIAANLANAETTHTQAGGPFKRREVVFQTEGGSSFGLSLASARTGEVAGEVRVAEVVDDPSPPVMRYEPGHPDANKQGYVAYPAINPAMEMVDLMDAARAYQLNASAVAATKQMIQQTIEVLKS